MITHIYIKDFAIIREIDIDLGDNLNIITGETGTGKSIVIQAIDMALGGRGSSSLIADWADKALVQLIFSLDPVEKENALNYISDFEDSEMIISRELSRSGKSIARVNGEIVTLSTLRKITAKLVDIHGQYDNQRLLDPINHLSIIDEFGDKNIGTVKDELARTFEDYSKTRLALKKLRQDHSDFLRKRDFMEFELKEIQAADPKPGEDTELAEHLNILQNSGKILENLSECYDILYNSQLGKAASLLSEISEYNEELASFTETISNCSYAVEDLCEDIRKARDSISFTGEELDSTIERLDLLDKLKRKYGGSIESVLEYREECEKDLELFESSDEAEKDLLDKLRQLRRELTDRSSALTELRREAAEELAERMNSELADLNFANAEFAVDMKPRLRPDGSPDVSQDGADDVEFLFNANRGGSLRPMAQIASGGEISRISLAFRRITNNTDHVRVMIFDEIDTGISGITASVVGRKLHQISRDDQILCITHLPQIAAAGDQQYMIARDDTDEHSFTTISGLDEEQRVTEIARLLGGDNITDTTLASARELIASARR